MSNVTVRAFASRQSRDASVGRPGVVLQYPTERTAKAAGRPVPSVAPKTRKPRSALTMGARRRCAAEMDALAPREPTEGLTRDFDDLLGVTGGNLEPMRNRTPNGDVAGVQPRAAAAIVATDRTSSLTRRIGIPANCNVATTDLMSPGRLIHGMEGIVRSSTALGVQVDIEVASDWSVRVDRSRFENAVLNLCLNARDAMPEGGILNVRCSDVVVDEARGNLKAGDYVVVEVRDTGMGMTPEVLARSMHPFFTTKAEGHGRGLGLAMANAFATRTGGSLRCSSSVGHGTTMTLYVPRFA